MRKLGTLTAVAALMIGALALAVAPATADKQTNSGTQTGSQIIIKGQKGQSDHALFTSDGGDTAIYCGVELDLLVEPWFLHVSASAPSAAGAIRITFNDPDFIEFAVAAGSSFSITQAMGGVGGVTDFGEGNVVSEFGKDDLVMITAADGVTLMMASAAVNSRATDPFDETFNDESGEGFGDAEPDNFCITAPADPGADWAAANFPENTL